MILSRSQCPDAPHTRLIDQDVGSVGFSPEIKSRISSVCRWIHNQRPLTLSSSDLCAPVPHREASTQQRSLQPTFPSVLFHNNTTRKPTKLTSTPGLSTSTSTAQSRLELKLSQHPLLSPESLAYAIRQNPRGAGFLNVSLVEELLDKAPYLILDSLIKDLKKASYHRTEDLLQLWDFFTTALYL